MTTAFSPCLKRTDWRPLYRAAILETDKKVLPQRVSVAESAVIARRREIFYADGTPKRKKPWKTHYTRCMRSKPLGSTAMLRSSAPYVGPQLRSAGIFVRLAGDGK